MQAVTITQITYSELESLIHKSINSFMGEKTITDPIKSNKDKYLTTNEASEFLGLAVATVYSKVSRGELPSIKRGKKLYFSEVELIDYIKSGRRKTNAEISAEADTYLAK